MAEGKNNWVGYAVVAAIAFGAGRSCQDQPDTAPIILPVASSSTAPTISADLAAATAAEAAGDAANAAGDAAGASTSASGIQPIYAAPVYDEPAYTSFGNCSEARVAGAAPVYAGEPGYGRHLDRDGDGVGCE